MSLLNLPPKNFFGLWTASATHLFSQAVALEGKLLLFLFVFKLNISPDYSQTSPNQERITRIQNLLQSMTPLDREKRLDSIKQLLEGTQTTWGRPTAAEKKPPITESCNPSGFEYAKPNKSKLQGKEEEKTQMKEEKKTRTQPSCSSSIKKKKIKPPPEAPHLITEIPSMAQDYIENIFNIKANRHCGFRAISHEICGKNLSQVNTSITQGKTFRISFRVARSKEHVIQFSTEETKDCVIFFPHCQLELLKVQPATHCEDTGVGHTSNLGGSQVKNPFIAAPKILNIYQIPWKLCLVHILWNIPEHCIIALLHRMKIQLLSFCRFFKKKCIVFLKNLGKLFFLFLAWIMHLESVTGRPEGTRL
ncbi:hypothetical protein VP01_3831g1 [Puccinia sorghi]|uniref:Uncharacterized protein n=1 Tax=Puccinia sorghi TaxID=27349 RepID=A0A0L6UT63_9BASI|nr:hypothetical protein VP01_3831g1 [Puccinia sorghi]